MLVLPAPPRGRRLFTLTVMAMVVVASIGTLTSLGPDLRYFFAAGQAVDLGAATEIDPDALPTNVFARVTGTPMASGIVRYETLLFGDRYAVFPLAGQRTMMVRVAVHDLEQWKTTPRREFSGRLVTFGDLGGRMESVRRRLARELDAEVSSGTFVLLADEPPARYGWALGLSGLCLLFILINVGMLVRWFRPL